MTDDDAPPCPHPVVRMIYAPPNGRWVCDTCRDVFELRSVFALPDGRHVVPDPDPSSVRLPNVAGPVRTYWLCRWDGSVHRRGLYHPGDIRLVPDPDAFP